MGLDGLLGRDLLRRWKPDLIILRIQCRKVVKLVLEDWKSKKETAR